MQELEKILEEIEDLQDVSGWDLLTVQGILKIIRKHMNSGWISVDDERLWDILFEEACVEGEQGRRIHDRLKDISSKL